MSLKHEFALRLAEGCGSSEVAKVQRLLKIPYQSAKNYLGGRLPSAEALISISQCTGVSIDWLLTGLGKKFLEPSINASAPPAFGQIEESVRRICVEVINEMNGNHHPDQPKTIRLQSSDVMSEEVRDKTVTSTGRRR
jgi:hypothetical protein